MQNFFQNPTFGVLGFIFLILIIDRTARAFRKFFIFADNENSGDYFVDNKTAVLSYQKNKLKEVIYGPKWIFMNHQRMRTFNLNSIHVSLSSYKYRCKDKNRISLDLRLCLDFADFDNISKYNNHAYSQFIKEEIQPKCCDEFQRIISEYTKEEILDNLNVVKEEIKSACDPIIFDIVGYKIQSVSIFELR
jgi:hypothetical protein